MPFDDRLFDGIFCYALIHLLDEQERQKWIFDCYRQLSGTGYMIFTAITKEAPTYGRGKCIGEDRYELHEGVKIYFYDSIQADFANAGLIEVMEIDEHQPFFLVKCAKGHPAPTK